MKKRYLILSLVLIGLIVFFLVTGEKKKERIRREKALLTIETTGLSNYDYDVSKGYIGTLYPAHKFELHSKVGGRIIEMNYDIGDRIQNGSAIAQIDDTQYRLEFTQAQGRLNIEQSRVRQKELTIELAEKDYQRMLALDNLVSQSALEKAKFDFEEKKITIEVDKANLRMQETALEMSALEWSYTKIEARWAQEEDQGTRILAERFVDEGAMITPNTSIATIIDVGMLKAEIFVGEKEYPHFKSGMKVTIEVDAFPRVLFEGSVARVAPFINELTRQAKVLINVKNEDLRLRPGMFARTNVIFRTRKEVAMLPKICILEVKEQQGVYLYDEASRTVSFVPVKIGAVRQGKAEILNAEEIDKPVVFVGQHMVKNGESVHLATDGKRSKRAAPGPGKKNPKKGP